MATAEAVICALTKIPGITHLEVRPSGAVILITDRIDDYLRVGPALDAMGVTWRQETGRRIIVTTPLLAR